MLNRLSISFIPLPPHTHHNPEVHRVDDAILIDVSFGFSNNANLVW